jgi:hypothetical protein
MAHQRRLSVFTVAAVCDRRKAETGVLAEKLIGAHSIIYSKNPEADRAFLRDVLRISHVDVGGGWLIFRIASG